MSHDTAGLRSRLRARRRSLTEADRRRAVERLGQSLLDLPELADGGRLATYLPADGELDPNVALDTLRARGWTVHLPVVGSDHAMTFVEWQPGDVLHPNRYGIDEPVAGADRSSRLATELDVVLVPCVAADGLGNRVGMGAGYYDRALAGVSDTPGAARLVGVVHDHAVVQSLEPEPWDVPLDVVVTDQRVLRPA